MSVRFPIRRPGILGVSSLAMLAAIGLPAQAQHANLLVPTAAEVVIQEENLSLATDTKIAQEIQTFFLDETFEEMFADRFEDQATLAARLAYANEIFEPVWTRKGAKSLLSVAAEPEQFGLAADAFADLDVEGLVDARFKKGNLESQARADLKLTAAWMTMASRISGGLSKAGEAIASKDDAPARNVLTAALTASGKGNVQDNLAAFEPSFPQYQNLKQALGTYQALAKEGGWKAISTEGETLEPGMTDMRIPAIRERLAMEGFYPAHKIVSAFAEAITAGLKSVSSEENEDASTLSDFEKWLVTYDESLEEAVKSFQSRHGLAVDGVLGDHTLEALNESAESKVIRIQDAMNDWRQQADFGERYVWANIPSYMVEGWDDGVLEISMKSIVGLPSRATPVFSDEIEYVVANPRWYAPQSIVARDKLPKLQRDPSYASRNGYSIFDRDTGDRVAAETIDWTDPSAAQDYQFIQAAGSGNALGALKIIFPNQHSVYLHGTPDKHLFERDQRALSSGCVRLEDPVAMAEWLSGKAGIEAGMSIREAVESGQNRKISFEETTPVHITYVTVTADEDGLASFWRDVYHKEASPAAATQVAELYVPSSERQDDAPVRLAGTGQDNSVKTLN